jgi:hypothetical protein
MAMSEVELRAAIAGNPFWYHTMELARRVKDAASISL